MSAGIDYGMGQTNIDTATGIRYGIHSANSVSSESIDEVMFNGRDLGWESWRRQVLDELSSAVNGVLDSYTLKTADPDMIDELFDQLELAEVYGEDGWDGPWLLEEDGLQVQCDAQYVWVFKSPYYTYAAYCSPCMPGAGDLDSPYDDGVKTYCLGLDWFDDCAKCPYPIYRVSDNMKVYEPNL